MGVLSANVLSALNAQYWHEASNAFRYDLLSSAAEDRGLDGTASFFRAQADGERGHAAKVKKYIEDRNESIRAGDINLDGPIESSLIAAFEFALDVERATTAKLEMLHNIASASGDLMTCAWLYGDLIPEQVEEENVIQTILDRYAVRAALPDEIGEIEHDIDVWIKGRL